MIRRVSSLCTMLVRSPNLSASCFRLLSAFSKYL